MNSAHQPSQRELSDLEFSEVRTDKCNGSLGAMRGLGYAMLVMALTYSLGIWLCFHT
jgi:hypothetical protein